MCRYGGRAVTEHCPSAVLLLSVQSIVGVVIQVERLGCRLYDITVQACMAGIVFAKFTKPTGRAETLLFSEYKQ